METQRLKQQEVFPSKEVLQNTLGSIYPVYESLMNNITNLPYGLAHEWNYYKDAKSWLCKVFHKKKTIFWLSVWEGYFQISVYFTEKHLENIAALDIDKQIKEDFYRMKPVGKLLPMIFRMDRKEQLPDLLKVIELKKEI